MLNISNRSNKLTILLIHIGASAVLAYLAYAIITRSQIPVWVGVALGVLAVAMIVTGVYFYIQKEYFTEQERRLRQARDERRHRPSADEIIAQRGLHFDPDDPNYDPIGGVTVGWL